jgi:hypothetical protein
VYVTPRQTITQWIIQPLQIKRVEGKHTFSNGAEIVQCPLQANRIVQKQSAARAARYKQNKKEQHFNY